MMVMVNSYRFLYHLKKTEDLLVYKFLQAISCIQSLTQEVPEDGQEENRPNTHIIYPIGFNEVGKEEKYE